MDIQPRDLLDIISRIGNGCTEDLGDARLNTILRTVRNNPIFPLTLRCVVSGLFDYQNPSHSEDVSHKNLFAIRCNLKIIQMLGLAPGDTRPAIDLFGRVLKNIETARNILWFEETTSEMWKGISQSECHYEKGRAMGLEAIIPLRSRAERERVKKESVAAMYQAKMLKIRPHHLMCMTCFYGKQYGAGPIAEDNLFEAIDIIHNNPKIPIELVSGPCMICPPCSTYHPASNKCIGSHGMSLRDELKDLNVLRRLGLQYGDILPAEKLFALLFERIIDTREVCGFDGVVRGSEWTTCGGPEGNMNYAKGRMEGLGFLKLSGIVK